MLAGRGELVPGGKEPGPDGAAQNPGGQVQAVPFQCRITDLPAEAALQVVDPARHFWA